MFSLPLFTSVSPEVQNTFRTAVLVFQYKHNFLPLIALVCALLLFDQFCYVFTGIYYLD